MLYFTYRNAKEVHVAADDIGWLWIAVMEYDLHLPALSQLPCRREDDLNTQKTTHFPSCNHLQYEPNQIISTAGQL